MIENWEQTCENRVISTPIKLTPKFLAFINEFDFGIFKYKPPLDLLDEHRQTKHHAIRFGGGLVKRRPAPPAPDKDIRASESRYVGQLFDAYTDHLGNLVEFIEDLRKHPSLKQHFDRQREHFYSAESLKEFERDQLPNTESFDNLKEEVYQGIIDTVNDSYVDGYERIKATIKVAFSCQITSYPLTSVLTLQDRGGICHHLANENRITWVQA